MQQMDWSSFRNTTHTEESIRAAWSTYTPAFAEQRANLQRINAHHRPAAVACLGAGTLADIPIFDFLDRGSKVHLVEWFPGLTESAYKLLVRDRGNGQPESDSLPVFIEGDVTNGRALAFGDRFESIVESAPDVVSAIRLASELASQCGHINQPIDLPDGSFDLVVSSMVASQFYHYPFIFFLNALQNRFGQQSQDDDPQVFAQLKQMRMQLCEVLIQGHIQELYRLVSENGTVYFSMDMFREDQDSGNYYLFAPGQYALRLLSELFWCRFDVIPPSGTVSTVKLPLTLASDNLTHEIVHSYVMQPRFGE